MASTKSNENLINSRLKMFQTVSSMASSSKPPPPLPAKPNKIPITTDQAISAAKFLQKNVKPEHATAAAKFGADVYDRNSDQISKNYNTGDAGKVLATAKLIQSMNNSTTTPSNSLSTPPQNSSLMMKNSNFSNSSNFSPSKPLPPLPTIIKKSSLPNSRSSDFNRISTSSTNVKEISSKLQENLHAPTVVRPQMRPKNDSFDQKSNSVKALRADLETKLNFGPPTVVYQNKRRSSTSNQDYNANLTSSTSYPTNFESDAVNDDYSYNAYPRMLTASPTTKSPPQPDRPPPPMTQSTPQRSTTANDREPHGIMLYDFNGEHNDELSCKDGDRVILKNPINDDWIYAYNPRTQCSGIVPKAYVDVKIPLVNAPQPKSPTITNKTDIWDDDSGVDSSHDGPRCYTLHDFNSGEQGDLAFCQGEIVRLISRINVEWLEGEAHDGRRGIFPSSFVEIIEDLPSVDNSPRIASGFSTAKDLKHASGSPQKSCLAIALYDFYGQNEGELSFNAGEQIEVTNFLNEDWLAGNVIASHKSGIFPSSFVEYITSYGAKTDQKAKHSAIPAHHNQNAIVGKTVIALYDYKSDQTSDLCFQAGDEIEITNTIDGDWMEGRLNVGLSNKRSWPVGLFPRNYVNFDS